MTQINPRRTLFPMEEFHKLRRWAITNGWTELAPTPAAEWEITRLLNRAGELSIFYKTGRGYASAPRGDAQELLIAWRKHGQA